MSVTDPARNPFPNAPLRVIREKGLNANNVRSCGVFEQDKVAGCSQAATCAKRGFGTRALFGFGPRSDEPGTGGEGPKYVGFYQRDGASGMERMDYMPCFVAVSSLMDKHRDQGETGDIVKFLGVEGTKIITYHLEPVDPNANKTGDTRLKRVRSEIEVPAWPTLETISPMLEYSKEMEAITKRIERQRLLEESAADGFGPEDPAAEDETDEIVVPPATGTSATATPKGGRTRGAATGGG